MNKESSKVNAKPSHSSDESHLIVSGPIWYPQVGFFRFVIEYENVTAETLIILKILIFFFIITHTPFLLIDKKLRKRTTETREVTKELRKKNEESKKVNDKQSPSSDESTLVVDVPQITTDEAEHSADLPKRGTDESKCAPEQSNKDTSDSDRETSSATKLKRMFPCKVCGKEFVLEKWLKKHSRKHLGRRLQNEKKRKREQYLGEDKLMEQAGMRWGEEEERLDKTSTSNLNPNTVCVLQKPEE